MSTEKLSEQLKKLTVKIISFNGEVSGSGVIFQSANDKENTYVFTAKHCILKKRSKIKPNEKDVEVQYKFNDNDKFKRFKVNRIVFTKKDFVILLISTAEIKKNISIPNSIGIINDALHGNEYNYTFRGYPKGLNKKAHPFTKIKHLEDSDFPEFKIIVESDLWSSDPANELVEGLSGSGLFLKTNQKLYLVGIILRLLTPDGLFATFKCFGLNQIDKIFKRNGLPPIEVVNREIIKDLVDYEDYRSLSHYDRLKRGNLFLKKRKYDLAIKWFEASLGGTLNQKEEEKIHKNIKKCEREIEYKNLIKRGKIEGENNNLERAIEYYKEAQSISNRKEIRILIEDSQKKLNVQKSTLFNQKGDEFYEQQNYFEALEFYKKTNSLFPEDSLSQKKILCCEGDIANQLGNYEEAYQKYSESKNIIGNDTSGEIFDNSLNEKINQLIHHSKSEYYYELLNNGDNYLKSFTIDPFERVNQINKALEFYSEAKEVFDTTDVNQRIGECLKKQRVIAKLKIAGLMIFFIIFIIYHFDNKRKLIVNYKENYAAGTYYLQKTIFPLENTIMIDSAIIYYNQALIYNKADSVRSILNLLHQKKEKFRLKVEKDIRTKSKRKFMEPGYPEGLRLFKYEENGKFGYINKNKAVVILPKYDWISTKDKSIFFHKDFFNATIKAKVKMGKKCFYIDKNDKYIRSCKC